MRAQIRVLECGTWESSSKAGQSPVPGDFPGGLLDHASQGALAGLMRHFHELMLLSANLGESVLVPALCRASCFQVSNLFTSVAKALSFLGWLSGIVDRLFRGKQQPPSQS